MKKILEVIIILTIFISGACLILFSGVGVTNQERTMLFMENLGDGNPVAIAECLSEDENTAEY